MISGTEYVPAVSLSGLNSRSCPPIKNFQFGETHNVDSIKTSTSERAPLQSNLDGLGEDVLRQILRHSARAGSNPAAVLLVNKALSASLAVREAALAFAVKRRLPSALSALTPPRRAEWAKIDKLRDLIAEGDMRERLRQFAFMTTYSKPESAHYSFDTALLTLRFVATEPDRLIGYAAVDHCLSLVERLPVDRRMIVCSQAVKALLHLLDRPLRAEEPRALIAAGELRAARLLEKMIRMCSLLEEPERTMLFISTKQIAEDLSHSQKLVVWASILECSHLLQSPTLRASTVDETMQVLSMAESCESAAGERLHVELLRAIPFLSSEQINPVYSQVVAGVIAARNPAMDADFRHHLLPLIASTSPSVRRVLQGRLINEMSAMEQERCLRFAETLGRSLHHTDPSDRQTVFVAISALLPIDGSTVGGGPQRYYGEFLNPNNAAETHRFMMHYLARVPPWRPTASAEPS